MAHPCGDSAPPAWQGWDLGLWSSWEHRWGLGRTWDCCHLTKVPQPVATTSLNNGQAEGTGDGH